MFSLNVFYRLTDLHTMNSYCTNGQFCGFNLIPSLMFYDD